jgi:hypothetical protein
MSDQDSFTFDHTTKGTKKSLCLQFFLKEVCACSCRICISTRCSPESFGDLCLVFLFEGIFVSVVST